MWRFSKAESPKPVTVAPAAAVEIPPRPKLWSPPAWNIELFAQTGEPRWCAVATTFEVFGLGQRWQQYWERRLYVFRGGEVYIDQQPGRPILKTAHLLAAIADGRLVYFPPNGGEVYRMGVVYTVNVVASQLSPEDLVLDVADVQEQLAGEEPRITRCRKALTEWAQSPDDQRTNALREHYYSLSTAARRYLMGMDAKDNAVRVFFEAKDEEQRALWKESLLATCRTYADEFKA